MFDVLFFSPSRQKQLSAYGTMPYALYPEPLNLEPIFIEHPASSKQF
jgi:hypothetical protein